MTKLSQVVRDYENLAEPPVGQANTSIAKLTAAGVVLLPVGYVLLLALINWLLPDADAERAKEVLDTFVPYIAAAIGAGGPLALFGRSLMLTQGKIKNQTAPDALRSPGVQAALGHLAGVQDQSTLPPLSQPPKYSEGTGEIMEPAEMNDGLVVTGTPTPAPAVTAPVMAGEVFDAEHAG